MATKAGSVSIDVQADLSQFIKSISTGVTDQIKRINPLRVFVEADTTAAMNSINDLLTAAKGEAPSLIVNAEIDKALDGIHSLTEAATAEIANVDVTAATDVARAGIEDLGQFAAALGPTVDVKATTDVARASIAELGKAVDTPVIGKPDFAAVRAEREEMGKPIEVPVVSKGDSGGGGGGGALLGGARGAVGLAGGAVSVKSIIDSLAGVGDVDQALGRIGVNAQFTGSKVGDLNKQLGSLKDVAGELGADPKYGKFATADFIEASEVLTKANLSIEDTKKLLPAVGDLAITSGQDLVTATAQLAQFRQVLQVKPGDEKNVVDILTNADIAGTFGTISDYSTALGYVGLQYTNMIDPAKRGTTAVKDLLGAFTFADNAGIRVGKLGTTMQSFLSDISGGGGQAAQKQIAALTDSFEKQQGVLKDGGDIFFKGNGQLRDMTEIQKNLQISTSKLNPLIKSQALNTIFQTDSQQLANAMLADTTGVLAATTEQMDKQGFAAKYAANNTAGYKGSVEGLKGSFGGLSQTIGDVLKGPAETALRGLGDYIGEISSVIKGFDTGGLKGVADAFNNMSGPAKIATGVIVAFGAAALLALTPVIAGAVAAAAPFVLLGAAIAGIGAALIYAYGHFEGFRNAVDGAAKFLQENLPKAIDRVKEVLGEFGGYLVDTFGPLLDKIGPLFQAAFDLVTAVVDTAVKIIKDLWSRFGEDLLNDAKKAIEGVRDVIDGTLTVITGIFNVFKSILTGDWSGLWDGIQQVFSGIWKVIQGLVETGWAAIKATFDLAVGVVKAAWSLLWNSLKTLFSDIWGGIKVAIQAALDGVSSIVDGIKSKVSAAWHAIWDGLKDVFSTIWGGIKTVVETAVSDVPKALLGAVKDAASAGGRIAGDFIKAVVSGIKNAAGEILSAAKSIIPSPGDIVKGTVGAVKKGIGILNPFDADGGLYPSIHRSAGFYTTVPRWRLAGEAGDEVVLPLERPGRLAHLVNLPAVRPAIEAALNVNGNGSSGPQFVVNMPPIQDPEQWLDALEDRVRLRAPGSVLGPAIVRGPRR